MIILPFFPADHMLWYNSWSETLDAVKKKVLSDAQTHAYMTSRDDSVLSLPDYDWYNTRLNPVKPVNDIRQYFNTLHLQSILFLTKITELKILFNHLFTCIFK